MFTIIAAQERRRIDIPELQFIGSLLGRPDIVTSPLRKPEPEPGPVQTPYGPSAARNKIGGLVASRLDVTDAAKSLREDLARTFPGSKFCVSVERYSGGESINVSWVDGPPTVEVDKLLNRYQDIDYDPYTNEILSGANRYVQSSRRYTKDVREREEKEFREGMGFLTAWQKLSSTSYPEVPFKCVRGHATAPEAA